jgi:hypothetical protein
MSYAKTFLDHLIPPLAAALALLIPVLTTWLAVHLRKVLGLQAKEKAITLDEAIALSAVAYAKQLRKSKYHPEVITGHQQLEAAIEFLKAMAIEHGLGEKSIQYSTKIVEAALGKVDEGIPTSSTGVTVNVTPSQAPPPQVDLSPL